MHINFLKQIRDWIKLHVKKLYNFLGVHLFQEIIKNLLFQMNKKCFKIIISKFIETFSGIISISTS